MDSFFNQIDARDELDEILKENSIDILYVRSNIDSRCKCYDELHNDGNSKCKICGGSGLLSSIEKIDAFLNPISYDDTFKMSGQKRSELGDVNVITQTFYMKHKHKPKVGDRILVVGYNKDKIPVEVETTGSVAIVRPVRGYKGRIEMYKVICRTSPHLVDLDQRRLNSIPKGGKAKLMKGVRYQWGS